MLVLESVLSKFLLVGATGKFAHAFILLRKEKYFSSLFETYEKAPIFDFDYLQKIDELPTNKTIALCAQVDSDSKSVKFGKLSQDKKIVFSSIIPDTKNDKFWKVENNDIDFNVCNMTGDTIKIRNNEPLIFFYNLNKLGGPYSASKNSITLDFLQKMRSLRGEEIFFNELAIIPNNKYVFFGRFSKEGENYYFDTDCISGESKDLLLKYLDDYIVGTNKETKKALIYSLVILFVHFVLVKMLLRQGRRAENDKQIKKT